MASGGELEDLVTQAVESAGRRLRDQAGRLPDIGGDRKRFLTEADLRIEAELTDLVRACDPAARVWGEELHDDLGGARLADLPDVWVLDPISSTEAFLRGAPHYAVVASRVRHGRPVFAVVHDPAVDELFTARAGEGARLDGAPITVAALPDPLARDRLRVVAPLARSAVTDAEAAAWWAALAPYDVVRPLGSFALAYAWTAAGRYDGVVARTKDAFPEFAGALLLAEAGGALLAAGGQPPTEDDRWFYGGGPAVLPELAAVCAALAPATSHPDAHLESRARR